MKKDKNWEVTKTLEEKEDNLELSVFYGDTDKEIMKSNLNGLITAGMIYMNTEINK